MAAVGVLNAKADVLRALAAFTANSNAARGLQDVLKTNLGPNGTMKMLVGGGGQIKITKDGNVLLHEMQIQHPTASMISRASTAQDDISGDGTTSNVLIIGELLQQCERLIFDGVHTRLLCDGIDLARTETLKIVDEMKEEISGNVAEDRAILVNVAKTSLRTKLPFVLADHLTDAVVDAVSLIIQPEQQIDLHMIEILHMKHKLTSESRLIRGMVLDHGCRHPDMPRKLEKCYILTCNVSLEYEKSEVNSGFFYSSAEEREKLVAAERKFTDEKVLKITAFKQKYINNTGYNLVVLNQKGIDPPCLDILAKENIMALRRVKRRNMERITLCCGGNPLNSLEDLVLEDLGFADVVYEQTLGEEKFTFVEGVRNPLSCTILLKGPTDHSIAQMKDAIRDGLRAVKNSIEDKALLPGGGAFEIAAYCKLMEYKKKIPGKVKLGIEAFANSLLTIPKNLAANSGLDVQESLLKAIDEYEHSNGTPVGIDLTTGEPMSPKLQGVWDNYRVKRQLLSIAPSLAEQLLLVDEVMKAGKSMGGGR